jgi:hypothetical protein
MTAGPWSILRLSAYFVRFVQTGRFYQGILDDFSGSKGGVFLLSIF